MTENMIEFDDNSLNTIAHQILEDYDNKTPGFVFKKNNLRLRIEDAKRVQDKVTKLRENRGERVIGWKIGCTCENNQKKMVQKLKKGDLVLTGAFGAPRLLGETKTVEVKSSAFGSVGATFLS